MDHHRNKHMYKGKMPLPNDLVIERRIHNCQLCGKEILKDNYLISNHMKGCNMKSKSGHLNQSLKKTDIHDESKIVEDGCEFQCKHCTQVLDSWKGMTDHLMSHDLMETPLAAEDSVLKRKLHPCCICGIEVLRDNTIIKDHIRDVHNLTAKAYKRWLDVKAQVQKSTEEEARKEENLQIDTECDPVIDVQNIKLEIDSTSRMLDISTKCEKVITLEDSEDETEEVASESTVTIKQEPIDVVENTDKVEVETTTKIQIIMENDSRGRFVQTVADHLREANLSKGAMLVLQSKILATIAEHIS